MAVKTKVKVRNQEITKTHALYHGDCVETIKGIPDDSVGLSIFSPPFAQLYSYSDDLADMANSDNYGEFFLHFEFLVHQLKRVIMPGRIVAVHCMDLPTHKRNGDEIGLKDFSGDIIRLFQSCGFVFHSRHCIWKDPLIAATRTKAIGLAHKQIIKDSSLCRTGIPDYLLAFRKPGINPKPITHEYGLTEYYGSRSVPRELGKPANINKVYEPNPSPYDGGKDKRSHWIWQQYASPVWFDIRQTKVLPFRNAKEEDDERHICLARNSRVLTKERGYVPIQEVKEGEHCLTHLGRWRKVLAVKMTGVRPAITVRGQGVPGLTLTPDHKLWMRKYTKTNERNGAERTDPDWIEAKDSLRGYVNLKMPEEEETQWDKRFWWTVGRWLADGFWDSYGSAHISSGEAKLSSTLKNLGGLAGFKYFTGTAWDIRLLDKDKVLRNVLSRCGEYAYGKKLPPEAFCLPRKQARALVDGYLSGDGHLVLDRDRWMATSVSRDLLLGMSFLIQRAYGAIASVYAGREERDTFIQGRAVHTRQEWILSFDIPDSNKRHNTPFILKDGAWKKVRSIEDAGRVETWNVRVEEDESYTAEGCIVKNCPLQLDVINRCLVLWSAPKDAVLTPFMGVGSEVYCAVQMGRKGVGIELKQRYFRQALRNIHSLKTKADSVKNQSKKG